MACDPYLVAAFAVLGGGVIGGSCGGEGYLRGWVPGALPSGVCAAGGLRWHGLWLPFAARGGGRCLGGG